MSSVWAITSYYNPLGGSLRRRNYEVFRRHLDLPLLTVEWSPGGRFELAHDAAEIVVRVTDGDRLWQKDALLNIGLSALPAHCTHVAWLDCDVVFHEAGCLHAAARRADDADLVQLFEESRDLHEHAEVGGSREDIAAAPAALAREALLRAYARSGRLFAEVREATTGSGAGAPPAGKVGMGYMARRELIEQVRFYDANIVGGGDLVFVAALLGRLDQLFSYRRFAPRHRAHIERWAAGIDTARRGRPATFDCAPGTVSHLWHGDKRHRDYIGRYRILEDADYDPDEAVARTGSGVWRWRDPRGALSVAVTGYIDGRADG